MKAHYPRLVQRIQLGGGNLVLVEQMGKKGPYRWKCSCGGSDTGPDLGWTEKMLSVHSETWHPSHPPAPPPIPMLLWCPECGKRHVDAGEFATKKHHTHACQGCGHVWRPAVVATVGVQFLPGFKDGGDS